MVDEYEIIKIEQYPKPTSRGWKEEKVITFRIGDNDHIIRMADEGFTAKKAKAEVEKAAKEILDTMKPSKKE